MRHLLGIIHSICLWGLKADWLTGLMFLCAACTILFNVYFGTFVMTFSSIGEIGCMSIGKCHWMVIVVNLVKQIDFFAWCSLLVWLCICRGQYWVFPPLAAIITARHHSMLVTRHCKHSSWIFPIYLPGLAEVTKILRRVVHSGDYMAQFIQNLFYRVAVWLSCHCSILVTLSCWMKSMTIQARWGVALTSL